jgi:hypothetical protein
MEELIKKELFKNVDSFLNELELTMDYLDKQIITSIRDYIKNIDIDNEEFRKFLEYTTHHLGIFQPKISAVLFSEKKIKSDYYNFLNNIILFNNILNFRVFENESKNTKKSIIKYLYSIYMSTVFLYQTMSSKETELNEDDNLLTNKLTEFIKKIQIDAETALKDEDIKTKPHSSKSKKHLKIPKLSQSNPNLLEGLSGEGDIGNIMESILGNKEILNIASEISQKMQSENLNPMSMLSSLMTGNIENTPLQGLVSEIQQKVETKINNGEINKEQLENQAKNIMGTITNNSNALNSMSGMGDLINNIVKDMGKQG